jgi:hypothetical protein
MTNDPKRLVLAGYDDIADAYLERFGVSTVRQKWLSRLRESLPAGGGSVLDLGCGAGIPVARDLAEGKYPPAEPGALGIGPLEAAVRVADATLHSLAT